MELTSRIAKQDGEIVEAARGFKECGVTVISNDPVIVLPSEQGLFVCRKTRAIRKRFPNPFDFLFGAQKATPRAKIKKQPPCQKVKLFKQCSNSLLLKELTDDVISLICGASGAES